MWTGEPSVIYGNVRNNGCITSLPDNCAVEVPCLVDDNGIQPTFIGDLPPQLTALIRTNINVQELTVAALMTENREHIYHAAMMDPHTAAELDLDQIWALVDDLLAAHGDWLPAWVHGGVQRRRRGLSAEVCRRRVALAGTGFRGTYTWGRQLLTDCGAWVELVGLCDANRMRARAARQEIGVAIPDFAEVREMISATKPETVIVASRDDTHADVAVASLESGADVLVEKPMGTTLEACGRILAAERRTGRRVDVAFNYRFAPTARRLKELLLEKAIGEVVSVDFHWYLDVEHGADYFRRWHAFLVHSSSLFVHKATHHFDLLNWYLASDPVRGIRTRCPQSLRPPRRISRPPVPWMRSWLPVPRITSASKATRDWNCSTRRHRRRTAMSAMPACFARTSTFRIR